MNLIPNLEKFSLDNQSFGEIGYGMLKCTNQLTYPTSPSRARDGTMANINQIDSFVLPSVEIGFKLINYETFWRLRQFLMAKRTFNVTYYDVDFNKKVTHEMYVQPDELKDFFNRGYDVVGLQNYKITLVATLNETTLYTPKLIALTPNGMNKLLNNENHQQINEDDYSKKNDGTKKEVLLTLMARKWGRNAPFNGIPSGSDIIQSNDIKTRYALVRNYSYIESFEKMNVYNNAQSLEDKANAYSVKQGVYEINVGDRINIFDDTTIFCDDYIE